MEYIRVKTYSKIMGVSRQYIYSMIGRGLLGYKKIDGVIFVLKPKNNSTDNQQVTVDNKK